MCSACAQMLMMSLMMSLASTWWVYMAMISPFIYHAIGTLKWLKLCRVALHIHILLGSIQLDMSSVT